MHSEVYKKISYDKAYRKNRLDAALWILEHPETLEELLRYCFDKDIKLATKATWVLEFVCRKDLPFIFPYLDTIFKKLHTAKSDGQVRSFGLLCELLAVGYYKEQQKAYRDAITPYHKKVMTECFFDWMITNQKVACQARAMTALFYLGTEIDWIHSELAILIIEHLPQGSAGYKNRGQKTLAAIQKFSRK